MEEGIRLVPTRLGSKLMGWISLSLLLVFIAFMSFFLKAEKERTMDWTERMGVVISRTVEKGMEQSMNQGDMEAIQAIVEDVAQVSEIVGLRLVDERGVITRSSNVKEAGDVVHDSILRDAMESGTLASEIDAKARTLRLVSPLLNIGSCLECHEETGSGEPLGMLDLLISVDEQIASINRARWVMILLVLAMIVMVSGIFFILLHRLITRHLSSLSHAATLMAQGNTDITVDIDTNDEIGDLGKAFNAMAVNINDAHERNTSLIRGISDPLLTVNTDLKVSFMNEPLEVLTGYRREEAVGIMSCRELLKCGNCGENCALEAIVHGTRSSDSKSMNVTTRSGKSVPVVASNSALHDSRGRVTGAISILRDVTREREAEQKLANEVSWSQSVIKAIADPMFTVDKEKNITFINKAAATLSGYSREEAKGRKCFQVFKGDICREACIFDESAKQGKTLHGVERNLVPKEGAELLARASGSVLATADNVSVGFLEIVRDVTEERRHMDSLVEVLKHVQTASGTIIQMARSIVENSEEQKKSVSEQSSSVKEVATTIEELDITSQQTAEKAEGVVDKAQKTVQSSQEGQHAVDENIEVMNVIRNQVESIAEQILDLSQQAQQIGSIVTAVNDLAEQTNLLALNAAIEAARAGEHGRGFTVVAMEVKKLAEQSQAATGKISALIGEIQEATSTCVKVTEEGAKGVEEGVKLAATAGETIQRVMGTISETADAVQQIATIAKQQSVGIQQVSLAMANINSGMNQTTASAESLREGAETFSRLADQLNDLVRKYKL